MELQRTLRLFLWIRIQSPKNIKFLGTNVCLCPSVVVITENMSIGAYVGENELAMVNYALRVAEVLKMMEVRCPNVY